MPEENSSVQKVLHVSILPSIDPALEDRWERYIGIEKPHFVGVKMAFPGQWIHLLVLFQGYGTDTHMLADVDFRWTVQAEDRSVIHETGWLPGIKGRVLHADFVLRPKDPVTFLFPQTCQGDIYDLTVEGVCNISGRKAEAKVAIKLSQFRIEPKFQATQDLSEWIEGYLVNLDPERGLDAYLFAFDTLGKDYPDQFFSTLPFFAQLFSDQTWLFEETERLWDSFSQKHQGALSILFHAARRGSSIPELSELLGQRMKAPFPSLSAILGTPITHPQELDFHWAIFKACGHFDVFRKICSAIVPLPEAYAAAVSEEVQEAVIRTAGWSISEHLRMSSPKNNLTLTYAKAIFEEPDLDIRVYRFLEGILKREGWVPNPDFQ